MNESLKCNYFKLIQLTFYYQNKLQRIMRTTPRIGIMNNYTHWLWRFFLFRLGDHFCKALRSFLFKHFFRYAQIMSNHGIEILTSWWSTPNIILLCHCITLMTNDNISGYSFTRYSSLYFWAKQFIATTFYSTSK